MATVLLVQLGIAVLACGVLAVAAAPALTRPGRTSTPPPGGQAAQGSAAMMREAARRLADRGQELESATAAGAARVADASLVAAARTRRGSVAAARAGLRAAARAAAGVTDRITTTRAVVQRACDARRVSAAQQAPPPEQRVIDLRDTHRAGDAVGPRHRA